MEPAAAALGVFERKVLRKIFGPIRVDNDYRIPTYRKLYELFNDMDIAKRINIQRFCWIGHVVGMDEDAPNAVVGDHRRNDRKDQVEQRPWFRLVWRTGGGARKAERKKI